MRWHLKDPGIMRASVACLLAVAAVLVAVPLLGAEAAPVDGEVLLLQDEVASEGPTKAASKALAGYVKAKKGSQRATGKAPKGPKRKREAPKRKPSPKQVRKLAGGKKATKVLRKLVPKSKATKRNIMHQVRKVQRDREKARRTERVVRAMKKEKGAEKQLSKKLQHRQERAIQREAKASSKFKKKEEKRKASRKPKVHARKSEVSEYSVSTTKGVITAKSTSDTPLHSKKLHREKVYNEYTDSVDKHPKDKTDHCARCKQRCKTGACKTWCAMRWCAKVTKVDIKKNMRHSKQPVSAKSAVCKMCNQPAS